MLRACTQHRLSLELCLFIFTEQPQLLSLNTKQMAGRILSHAEALDLLPADVADTLTRCPALLDVLPLRCVRCCRRLGVIGWCWRVAITVVCLLPFVLLVQQQ